MHRVFLIVHCMAPTDARGIRLASAAALAALLLASCGRSPPAAAPATPPPPPQYVGAAACAGCHAAEAAAWRASQHAHAMQAAAPGSVLGRFDGRTPKGIPARFSRDASGYVVHTAGRDGRGGDFTVGYSFGIEPLQQYLVPFADGRLQALPYAWDARPAARGGQRWFDLQAGDPASPGEARHWTGPDQNWNYFCADCHSTNLRRNYDAAQDRYATRWSDPAVACEACHGPGSRHLAWARHEPGADDANRGLAVALDERRGVGWSHDAAGGEPRRSQPLAAHREIETCAACHSRRRPLGDDPTPTGRLLDRYEPALLDPGLYYPDGQQQGEVYIYGSFLQSRMYAAGVTCSDCHEPHSGKLRAEGNALCTQCHEAARYDNRAHHLHAAGSAGAQCVDCHMPARTYMQIDPRRDHSLRVPRPDLSLQYGVPNACNSCHRDRGADWAAAAIGQAHGPQRRGYQHFAAALDAARRQAPQAVDQLLALAADAAAPAIARATAVAALNRPGPRSFQALQQAARDADPLLRDAALEAVLSYPPRQRATLALPLADDPVPAVRLKAGHALAAVPDALLDPAQRGVRERAYAAWRASELASAERPESRLNLGGIAAERGEAEEARAQFEAARKLDPRFAPAWADLAGLEQALGHEAQGGAILEQALRQQPGNAMLLHQRGLWLVRNDRLREALEPLRRAAAAEPGNTRYAYVYAVALHAVGQTAPALSLLEQALRGAPGEPELLEAAAAYAREAGQAGKAEEYARRHEAAIRY
ncbi:MAG TPA: cytochrome c3 family protein [Nevskia sp.]|nr:cytochrome c3 family protein [Nevskia sp.]